MGRAGRKAGKQRPGRPRLRPDVCLPVPAGAQENLLLSILPAHISMGMKLTIIERLKERGDRRYMPDNNFHSLYVKRHQNVRWVGGACAHGASGSPAPALLSLQSALCPEETRAQASRGSGRHKSRPLAGPQPPHLFPRG